MYFDYKYLSKSIRNNMKYGDTVRTIGNEMDLSASTVSRLLNNKGKSDIDTILKVCKWLDKPLDKFIKE